MLLKEFINELSGFCCSDCNLDCFKAIYTDKCPCKNCKACNNADADHHEECKFDYYKKAKEYADNFDYYLDTVKFADLSKPGFEYIGNVTIPDLSFLELITDDVRADGHNEDNVYTYGTHELLDKWALENFPNVKYQDVRVQMQQPGQKVDPHVDTLIGHIKNWMAIDPSLAELNHSMAEPAPELKAVRYFIACEDHVEGQNFIINNKPWVWKKGDIVSLDVHKGMHNTFNESNKDRYIIKLTGRYLPNNHNN